MVSFNKLDFLDVLNTTHFKESDPTIIANKINDLGVNGVTNAGIDSLLKTTNHNEAIGRNEIPIGNGQMLDLRDRNACQNFYNQIEDNLNVQNDAILDLEQKIKRAINEVYKGNGDVPFPEALPNEN
jgi:hypothetical protein